MQNIFYLCFVGLLGIGSMWIYEGFCLPAAVRSRTLLSRGKRVITTLKDREADEIFLQAGIRLSVKKYQMICNVITAAIFVYAMVQILDNQFMTGLKIAVIAVGFSLLTKPKEFLWGKIKSPFHWALTSFTKSYQERKDMELANLITQMRNLILSWGDMNRSTSYLLTRLIPYTSITKPILLQTHLLIMQGRREEAASFFSKRMGTKLGNEFSKILVKLDSLPQTEFLEQMNVLMANLEERRETKKEQQLQRSKMIIFLLASAEMLLIMFDFIYVILYDSILSINMLAG